MWQRALVRCGLPLRYSRGFNPRPRISLPLPRAVGLQSDEELLCAELAEEGTDVSVKDLRRQLDSFLPAGCEITGIEITEGSPHFAANEAEYLFERAETLPAKRWEELLGRCIQQHVSGESILLQRETPKHKSKTVDLQYFIETLTGNQDNLRIRCRIDSAGSVRVEELLKWFGIGPSDLARPPRRTSVVWIQN